MGIDLKKALSVFNNAWRQQEAPVRSEKNVLRPVDNVNHHQRTIEKIFRQESGRIMAALYRMLGDLDAAEKAMQDALVQALDFKAAAADREASSCRKPHVLVTTVAEGLALREPTPAQGYPVASLQELTIRPFDRYSACNPERTIGGNGDLDGQIWLDVLLIRLQGIGQGARWTSIDHRYELGQYMGVICLLGHLPSISQAGATESSVGAKRTIILHDNLSPLIDLLAIRHGILVGGLSTIEACGLMRPVTEGFGLGLAAAT